MISLKNGLATYGLQIMAWVTGGLFVALIGTVSYYRYQRAQDAVDFVNVQARADTAEAANKDAQEVISQLVISKQALVAKIAIDQAAAKEAGDRIAELTQKLVANSGENKRLRAKLAQENPDVAKYLDAGIPSKLSCQLWPESCPGQTPPGGKPGGGANAPRPKADNRR